MLSQDVVKVIDNISEKIETNNFESLTFEEIKNACFMLMGHIEHLKANYEFFPADMALDKELASYKRTIVNLNEWQSKFIEIQRYKILRNYITDLSFINELIHSIPEILGPVYKEKKEKISYYVSSLFTSINKLRYKLHKANCFDIALTAHTECSNEILFLYSKLLEMHHTAKMRNSLVIKGYFEILQETFDFYLKEITYFSDLETTNTKCLSYCLINYLPKNVRH